MRFDIRLFGVLVFVLALVITAGCGGSSGDGGERVVAAGDTVSLTYKGTLSDGTVFDSTGDGAPFTFVAGMQQVIQGFDQAVLGMALNEKKTFTIPDSLAYGKRKPPEIRKVPKSFFPEDMTPEEGQVLSLQDNMGNPFPGTIVEIAEDSVTLSLDMNPRLAGEDLTFDIEVVEIK